MLSRLHLLRDPDRPLAKRRARALALLAALLRLLAAKDSLRADPLKVRAFGPREQVGGERVVCKERFARKSPFAHV